MHETAERAPAVWKVFVRRSILMNLWSLAEVWQIDLVTFAMHSTMLCINMLA